jgi:hypothetical protein
VVRKNRDGYRSLPVWRSPFLFVVLLLGGGASFAADDTKPSELKAKFHQDFRVAEINNPVLRRIGVGARWEPEGARITLPAGMGVQPAAGVAPDIKLQGDFEITGAYEVLSADRPDTGYGVGVSLYAAIDPKTNDAVSLARRVMRDGAAKFVSNRMTPANGKLKDQVKTLPSAAPAGKMRIQRIGAQVRFSVAEGDNQEFTPMDEVKFGTADVQFVQFSGNAGNSASGLDLRLLDLTVRAERFLGGDQPPVAAAEARSRGWLAAGLGIVLVLTSSLALWLALRRRRVEKDAS